jgi:hypothetical protein
MLRTRSRRLVVVVTVALGSLLALAPAADAGWLWLPVNR